MERPFFSIGKLPAQFLLLPVFNFQPVGYPVGSSNRYWHRTGITNIMRPSCITVQFRYELRPDSIFIDLIADVEPLKDGGYLVKNIRKRIEAIESLIPAFILQKWNGEWAHKDSGKETNLSDAIGRAIDQLNEPSKKLGKIL
jgi:hypothetical protein